MAHHGGVVNTAKGLIFHSVSQRETFIYAGDELLRLTQVLAQCLRHVTELLASSHDLVPLCMSHLRALSSLLPPPPPMPFVSIALHKVIREEAQVIAILPWWP